MGPVTTGLGDVFQFTVEGDGVSAMERRTILDWLIAPRLRAVPGVTEVNAWGGLPKQYQVVVDPAKLLAYRIALKDVFEAVEKGNAQRRRGLHRAQPGAVHPARRGARRVARRHREDRPQGRRGRHAGDGRERRPGPRGGDAAHRRRHHRRPGRDRDRPRPDAGRRERPAGGDPRPPGGRGAAAVAAQGRPDRPLLRPRGLRPPRHPHGRDEPRSRERSSSWPSSSPSSATSGRG